MTSPARKLRIRAALAARHARSTRRDWPALDPARRKVVVALAADYANLGDVAIAYAQTEYLARVFPDAQILELPASQVATHVKSLRRSLNEDDVVTIVGGGNTGDQYDDIEALRQMIIRSFPRNQIVSFPQSISFSDTMYGRLAKAQLRRVYAAHRNLHLIARDSASLRAYGDLVPSVSLSLAPDIVLSLDQTQQVADRSGIVLSLRRDAESALRDEERQYIHREASKLGEVTLADTHLGQGRLTVERRTQALHTIWRTFSQSSLVVTDRLHGVIFCIITGTPCIALDSRGSKVAQFRADWLADNDSVRMITVDEIPELATTASELSAQALHPDQAERLRERIDSGILPFLLGQRAGD